MSIIWDEVEAIGERARELGIRPIYAPTEEADRREIEQELAKILKLTPKQDAFLDYMSEKYKAKHAKLNAQIEAEHQSDVEAMRAITTAFHLGVPSKVKTATEVMLAVDETDFLKLLWGDSDGV